MTAPTLPVVHIAGHVVQIGPHLRQRCAWCGAVLIDYDLDRLAVPVGQDPRPATWALGDLVAVDGNAQYVAELVPSEEAPGEMALPPGACGRLDPEATR